MENSMEVPRQTRNRITIWFSISTVRYMAKGKENSTSIFKVWNQLWCALINEWIKQMKYTHNGILFFHKIIEFYHLQQNKRAGRHYIKWNKSGTLMCARYKSWPNRSRQ
jgi:hypothetical protein